MSSFFTLSKSQKKRKRDEEATQTAPKRSVSNGIKPKRSRADRDESISGSEDEVDGHNRGHDAADLYESSSEDETAAERRLRLAEQYLENIKGEVQEVGFDAEQVDRDLIAERLQEDLAETKGRLYKHIASEFDFANATQTHFRTKAASMYGIAVCPPYAYTVTRDATVTKWRLPEPHPNTRMHPNKNPKSPKPVRRRPTKVAEITPKSAGKAVTHHTAPILAIAASSDGKYVVTGSSDNKLILYSTASPTEVTPIKSFPQHRDTITSLAFRPGTNQLFSASRDRTVKVWSMDEGAYVETLFGHQDEVVDVAPFPAVERCASVGARDRTARVWKVVEETQLVFRGGGSGSSKRDPRNGANGVEPERKKYSEGSIDRVAVIDNDTFVTGSDNGNLCLWSLTKKKPVYTVPLAHGLEKQMTAEECSAEMQLGPDFKLPERQPRWITALKAIPLSDLIVTGSWDGWVRVWRVSENKKAIEPLGTVGRVIEGEDGEQAGVQGLVNDLEVFERGERGKEGLCIVAAIGKEHRLGRWKTLRARGGAVVWEIPSLQPNKPTKSTQRAKPSEGKIAAAEI